MSYLLAGFLEMASWVKKRKCVFVLFFAFLWILYWGTSTCADYSNYEYAYRMVARGNFVWRSEIGYYLCMKIANILHLSLDVFFAIYSFVGLWLLSKTILRYADNPAIVLGLYFFYPFLLDVVQKRSFMGAAIVVYAVPFLFERGKLSGVKYALFCVLAAMFHTSCIAFLVFLLMRLRKRYVKIISVCIACAVLALPGRFMVFSGLMPVFIYQKFSGYMTHLYFGLSDAVDVAFFLAIDLSVIWICRKWMRQMPEGIQGGNRLSFYLGILKLSEILIGILPVIFLNPNFSRIPRAILPLQYIVLANAAWNAKTKKAIPWITILLALLGCRFAAWFFTGGMEAFVRPIMEENIWL